MKQTSQSRAFLPATEYRDWPKQLFDAFDRRHFVDHAGGHQEGARTHSAAVVE
jgi:hypothetical protein